MAAVRLTVVADGLEAEVVCGLLESSGIRCSYRKTDMAAGALEGIGLAGPHEVLVDVEDLEAARALLQEQSAG